MKLALQTFKHFSQFPQLVQVNSTRQGGFSTGNYTSLNMGKHSGDDGETVERNRTRFIKSLAIPPNRLVFPAQIHSARIKHVTEPGIVADCDALITAEDNLFLTIQTADCFPVFLVDPQVHAVGIVHSGWRGTAKRIVEKTIDLMCEKLNCQPARMYAGIGAGVQQSCYQVDELTAANFDSKFLIPDSPGHYKLDVQGRIIEQLNQAGLKAGNIQWDATCTHCAKDLYYSYRRDGQQSGRMMGVIGIHKK